jgi:hypothetical protein
MTEKESLERYIEGGFIPFMLVRTVSEAEKAKAQLPTPFLTRDVFALPLWHADARRLMFYFVEDETRDYAESLAAAQREVVGYHLCCHCGAVSQAFPLRGLIRFETVARSLVDIRQWDARIDEASGGFDIHFDIDSPEEDRAHDRIREVQDVLIALSLKNEVGFFVRRHSLVPKFRGQPQSITWGLEEVALSGLAPTDLGVLDGLRDSSDARSAAEILHLVYAQIDFRSKVIVGWAAIEELFNSAPQHMLSSEERKEIVTFAQQLRTLCEDQPRLKKLCDAIKDKDRMAKESKNERISRAIATFMHWNMSDVLETVRDLTRTRGRLAHSLSADNIGTEKHFKFVEAILKAWLRDQMASSARNDLAQNPG